MSASNSETDSGKRIFDQVHVLFQNACIQYPDHTAVEHGLQRVTYQELLNRVHAIRVLLQAHAMGKGKIVAVHGERSIDVIACVLAVWASGATVMLMESSLPEHRRNLMLQTVPTTLMASCGPELEIGNIPSVNVSKAPQVPVKLPLQNHTEDRAYIAFTSGSTGVPKAIVGSHNGLSQFLIWQSTEFKTGPHDRFAQFTNLSFDVWFRDVFTPLISGATVCIPDTPHPGARAAFEFLSESRITATHLVPSIANVWINTHHPVAPIALKHAFFAGEPLEGALVNKWRHVFPDCQIVNLYGPTETTLAKHFKRIDSTVKEGIQPVGCSIEGSNTFVLSEDGTLCAPGQVGEICISTPYGSHGYLTRAGLESPYVSGLIPEFDTVPLYRTGDLGRKNHSNEIEILGRKDEQIKINGVRIDLREVKSVLVTHPAIRDAFVCTRQQAFTKSIVAFIEAGDCSETEIFNFLKVRLPAVMVPGKLHRRDALPRLPNGKIDRRALMEEVNLQHTTFDVLQPGQLRSVADQIEKIWIELLENPDVSRSQNFFDAGGNSLSIVVLHEKVEKLFGLHLPLVQFFQTTTIETQAHAIEALLNTDPDKQTLTGQGPPTSKPGGRQRFIAVRTRHRTGNTT